MNMSTGADSAMTYRQHTLQRSTQWRVREHRRRWTDAIVIRPAEADTGVRFVLPGAAPDSRAIRAHWDAVVDTRNGVVLGNHKGETLRGAIPILAALHVAGIDNALVEVRDSSLLADASDFSFYLSMLIDAGTKAQTPERRLLRIVDTVEVRDSDGSVTLSPATDFNACINLKTIQADGNIDMACVTLWSDFTEPYAMFSSTSDDMRKRKAVQTGFVEMYQLLRDIRVMPDALRTTVVELFGHLTLAGGPIAASIRGHDLSPRLYQALLQTIMERRLISPTTVAAYRTRHDTAACPRAESANGSDSGANF
jgi:UDP-3-O-acyl-N-acetylglucosamine deacetylase